MLNYAASEVWEGRQYIELFFFDERQLVCGISREFVPQVRFEFIYFLLALRILYSTRIASPRKDIY